MTDASDELLIAEYEHVASIRLHHIGAYTQTEFYFGVILASIGAALAANVQWALMAVPAIVFVQLAIVQWNQYHHFLTEDYLCHLEDNVRSRSTSVGAMQYHGFFRDMFKQRILLRRSDGGYWSFAALPLIKPTAILSAQLAVFKCAVVVFCLSLCAKDFIGMFGVVLYVGGVLAYGIVFAALLYNFLMMPRLARPIIRSYLTRYVRRLRECREASA